MNTVVQKRLCNDCGTYSLHCNMDQYLIKKKIKKKISFGNWGKKLKMLDSVLGLKSVIFHHIPRSRMAMGCNMVKTEKEYNPALFSRFIIYHI